MNEGTSHDTSSLFKRINRLERLVVVLLLLIITGAAVGWMERERILKIDKVVATQIETNRLDVVDTSGKLRAKIALSPNQDFVSMKLFGKDTSTMRLSMGVSAATGTTGFALYNQAGKKIIFMTNDADTSTSITVYNKSGEIATNIVNNGQNNVIFSGNYVVTDKSGATRAVMGLSEGADGYPYMDLYDKGGMKRVGLFAQENLTYGLTLFDKVGLNRLTIGITPQNTGAAAIIGEDGKIIWKAP